MMKTTAFTLQESDVTANKKNVTYLNESNTHHVAELTIRLSFHCVKRLTTQAVICTVTYILQCTQFWISCITASENLTLVSSMMMMMMMMNNDKC